MLRSRNAGWLIPLLLTFSVALAAPRMTSKSKKAATREKESEAATSDSSAADKETSADAQDTDKGKAEKDKAGKKEKVIKTDAQWRRLLTHQQFEVTRLKETEAPFTGKYARSKKDGIYHCVCCGEPLFDSHAKFESGTGWPSYYEPIEKEALQELPDTSDGVFRTEVQCSRCDAHLGHVFPDGPDPTGLRYCINSASLKFESRGGKPAKEAAHDKKTGTKAKPAKGKAKPGKAKQTEEPESKSAE